jgi:hypothetical protein
MLAAADRMREPRQPDFEPLTGDVGERRERGGPAGRIGVSLPLPAVQLGSELQQPREPVRTLEAGPLGPRQERVLGREPFRREAALERRACARRERRFGIEARHPHERPVTVHRRVPVEAAEERRRQLAGAAGGRRRRSRAA